MAYIFVDVTGGAFRQTAAKAPGRPEKMYAVPVFPEVRGAAAEAALGSYGPFVPFVSFVRTGFACDAARRGRKGVKLVPGTHCRGAAPPWVLEQVQDDGEGWVQRAGNFL
jgi:hypothetical protein